MARWGSVGGAFLVLSAGLSGCSALRQERSGGELRVAGERAQATLVRLAAGLLDPTSARYNPEKARAYLEYAARNASGAKVELPARVLLELLRSERVAFERSRVLEEQFEIMKEIDLKKEEAL